MIAVLIDSRKIGASGWINVRSTQLVRVSGMQEGDRVKIHFNFPFSPIELEEDGELPLNSYTMVKGEIVKVSETSRIYVDLE